MRKLRQSERDSALHEIRWPVPMRQMLGIQVGTPMTRPAHRPPVLPADCRRVTVNLTADAIATARRLGAGNISEGVRRALDMMPPPIRKNGKTLTQAKAFAAAQGWPWPEDDDDDTLTQPPCQHAPIANE